jgi:hypothetical protein
MPRQEESGSTLKRLLNMIAYHIEPLKTEDIDGPVMSEELREVAAQLPIDTMLLDNQMAEQSGLFAYAATGEELWGSLTDTYTFEAKVIKATVDREIRQRNTRNRTTVTEPAIAAEVQLDERYKSAMLRALDADAIHRVYRALTRALRDRKDMLVGIASNKRAQLNAEGLHIGEQGARHVVKRSQHKHKSR